MRKRVFAILLSIVMVFSAVPLSDLVGLDLHSLFAVDTAAADLSATGNCGKEGDNVTWSFDSTTGTLTISGEGEMANYFVFPCSPFVYNCDIKTIIIDSDVTSIGNEAFGGCSSLTSINIPDGITSIGEYAFSQCSSLSSITIGNGVKRIGDSAFAGCSKLTSITVNEANTVFDSREKCNAIIRTDSNTLIVGCVNTSIPNSVTSIGDSAFKGCSALSTITIPDSVTSIGDSAFNGCSALSSITIPDSVTSIGDSAFNGCSALSSITIPDSVTSIGDSAFNGCSALSSITIPDSVTSIGDSAFSGCSALSTIILPNGVQSIKNNTFSYCSALSSIAIPNSVNIIGDFAFYNCSSLNTIYYSGSSDNWAKINIGSDNISLIICKKEYNHTHLFVSEKIINPTCTESGHTEYQCIYGEIITGDYSSPLGHKYDNGFVTAPTCTEKGYTTYICKNCSEKTFDNFIESTGHKLVVDEAKEATCAENGLTIGSHCEKCGTVLLAQTKIPALGHKPKDSEVTVEPTCSAEGVLTYTCSVCGATIVDVIPALAHKWNDGIITVEPTCTAEGVFTYTCSVCGEAMSNAISFLGHKSDEGKITTEPSYEAEGVKTFTCTVCGTVVKTEAVAKIEKTYTLGDIDDENGITVTDARFTLRVAIKLEICKKGSREFLACDVNGDNNVTVSDARSILRVAVKLDSADSWKKN